MRLRSKLTSDLQALMSFKAMRDFGDSGPKENQRSRGIVDGKVESTLHRTSRYSLVVNVEIESYAFSLIGLIVHVRTEETRRGDLAKTVWSLQRFV